VIFFCRDRRHGLVTRATFGFVRHHGSEEALVVFEKVGEVEEAIAFFGASFSEGEQSAEAAIRLTVGGPDQDVGGVVEGEACADDELGRDAALFTDHADGVVCADDAGEGVAVGDGDGAVAELGGAEDHFVRVGGAAEEGEIGGDVELGVGVISVGPGGARGVGEVAEFDVGVFGHVGGE
jgi:hypothetical protein